MLRIWYEQIDNYGMMEIDCFLMKTRDLKWNSYVNFTEFGWITQFLEAARLYGYILNEMFWYVHNEEI